MKIIVALAAAALLLAGCAPSMQTVGESTEKAEPEHHYAGERRSPQELAFLYTLGDQAKIFVQSLDDEKLASSIKTVTLPLQLYLLPGKHVIHARFLAVALGISTTSSELIPLEADLKAGHSYVVVIDELQGNRIKLKVADLGTNLPRRCLVHAIHKGLGSQETSMCVSQARPA